MGGRFVRAMAGASAFVLCAMLSPALAQSRDLGKVFSDALHQRLPGDTRQLSSAEVSDGLKEALSVAAERASSRLGARDGFFEDPEVRIGLPGVLVGVQSRLRPFGMSGPLDDLELRVNRGAEAAMPAAKKLVVDAIRSMTIEDAMSVLRGDDTAATQLLRSKTEVGLKQALSPYVESALSDAGALRAADSVVNRYARGLVDAEPRDIIITHAGDGAVEGFCHYVASEELAIRRDPVKRTSEILRKVFGG